MRFHAKYVSAAEAGDYYQVSFETEDPGDDATDLPGLDSPYLIIQRQFERLDGGRCYVETHDHGYVGHYRLKLIDFSPTQLVVAIERKSNTHVEVNQAFRFRAGQLLEEAVSQADHQRSLTLAGDAQ
jgi:hypothetical protein